MNLHQLKEMGYGIEVLRDCEFDSFCNVTTRTDTRCLSFAGDAGYVRRACVKENIAALIVPRSLADDPGLLGSGKGIAVHENPKYMLYRMHNDLAAGRDARYCRGDGGNSIGSGCAIHDSAIIAERSVRIGDGVVIEENAIIREGVSIGDGARIMAGAIIGYDACLAARDLDGNYMPILSAGTVRVGRNVRVGSYSAISRGLFPYECTSIGDNSQIGFCVDISHNVSIGKNVLVIDKSQVYGNTVVGDGARLSPQSVISNRLRVGDGADVAIGSVVVSNVRDGERVAGNYAIENGKFLLWHRKKQGVRARGGRSLSDSNPARKACCA